MIQVINRALDIMEYVARDPDTPKPLGDIASDLNLNAGTCANILKTLVTRGYLEKIDKQRGYCLGPKGYSIGGNEGYQKGIVDSAKDEMELLTKKTNENSLLCILRGNMRAVIFRVQSKNDLQANTATEKHAYDSASGRLLVAMLPDAELQKFVATHGLPDPDMWDGVTDERSFKKHIKKIRTQGYAIQTTVKQIVGIAFPVYKDERVVASVSIYMPAFRFSNVNKADIIRLISKTTEKISKKLS